MNKAVGFCAAALACGLAVPAAAGSAADTNFSYTYLGVDLARTNFDETIWVADEGYNAIGGLGINGAFQVQGLPLAFFGSASHQGNEGPRTELNLSGVTFGAAFPFRVADRVDLVPAIGYGSVEVEVCYDGLCAKADDSGALLGLGTRMWLVPDSLEFNLGYEVIDLEHGSESAIGAGIAGWFQQHHSLRLTGVFTDDANTVRLGYRYSW